MKYLLCILVPLLLQAATVYVIGVMNTGNGSWVGLGAFLFAIPVIPLTAIINAARTRRYHEEKTVKLFLQSLVVAIITPAVIVGLFIAATLVEGLVHRYL